MVHGPHLAHSFATASFDFSRHLMTSTIHAAENNIEQTIENDDGEFRLKPSSSANP